MNNNKYSFRNLFIMLLDRNLTAAQLAENCGISPSAISRLKKGHLINLDSLIKICAYLDCNLDDIMDISPNEPIN